MKLLAKILPLWSLLLLLGCAKQSTPQGGPIDEDPPNIISQYPENQSINTVPEEIIIEFDEYIKLDNPSKNIIITPRLDKDKIITTALKNRVRVDLNQELEENTTYVFNFQKSVQDASESNPAQNLKVVFSTGPTIDSLTVQGRVNVLFPDRNTDYRDVLIGLYRTQDTTDLFTSPPYYIGQADSTGNFQLENLREGEFLAYAWLDENNTLKAEGKNENFAFIKDTLTITPETEKLLHFNLAKSDQGEFKLNRSTESGSAYQLVFNKGLRDFALQHSTDHKLSFKINDDRVKIYSDQTIPDSLSLQIFATDSILQTVDSLVWAKFQESDRAKEELSVTVASGKSFFENLKMDLTFSKPLAAINYDSLQVVYDSAQFYQITPEMLSFKDSLRRDQLQIQLFVPDSLNQSIFTLSASDSTFKDVENQYNLQSISANFRKLKRESLADEISGSVNTGATNLIIQLLNSKEEVIKELEQSNQADFSFKLIEPGIYRLRVIEDTNGNGVWDPPNFATGRQPELVYYFLDPETQSKDITIRGGWTVGPLVIQSIPKSGILN